MANANKLAALGNPPAFSASAQIYLNGSTDYITISVGFGGGASQYINSGALFQGFLVRAA